MKLPSRKKLSRTRPEQSGYTLALAVFYSFFLHAAVVVVVLLLHFLVIPKAVLLPSYQVKLVGPPKESVPTPAAAPVPPKKEAMPETDKPSPKLKKAVVELKKAAPKKGDMPELARQKPKSTQQEKPETAPTKPSTAPPVPPTVAAQSGGKAEGVGEVNPTSQQFKFPPYLAIIRERIEQNWNPPPGGRNMRVKVLFSILRSGRVGDSKLEQSSGNTYFDLAAMRAIQSSSPFPALPEGFYQEAVMFSVDLMEKD